MAEYTASALQLVEADQNVQFTEAPFPCTRGNVTHRAGTGIFRLRGSSNQCRSIYKVSFGANIAIPTGGTVGEIAIAITQNGEALASATAIETPAAVEEFSNIYISALIPVPCGCCDTITVRNVSDDDTAINVQNANLIIERIA